MFVTARGMGAIEPTRIMYQESRKALTKLTKVSPQQVSNYFELGPVAGHAGDHLLTVALWKPEGVELAENQTYDHDRAVDSALLPQQMPIYAVSKVIEGRRVSVGADIPTLTFAASIETFASSSHARPETWQVQSVLGQIMAKDAMDVSTFAKHTTPAGEHIYYPLSMFDEATRENPAKVTRGFLFGLQEIAGALLAVTDSPSLEK